MAVQEIREQLWQVLGDRRGVAQQPHLAFDALGVFGQFLLQAFGLLQQNPGVSGQGIAGRRRADPTTIALKKLDAQRRLHGANSRAGRCEGQMTACGTGGDVASVEDVQVQAQVGQVEVHCSNLWMCVVWEAAIASKLAPTGDL
ncbi:hypothetical protein D3C86_1405480 [compost metagenome]